MPKQCPVLGFAIGADDIRYTLQEVERFFALSFLSSARARGTMLL